MSHKGRMTLPLPAISAILRSSPSSPPRAFSMEIHDTKRILAATRKAQARRAGDPVAVAPVARPAEILSLAGVADTELTPKLRQALTALLGEVEQLRRELAEARTR